jgi:Fe2+ or Zn2+ uptake regulation protein
MILGMSIDKVRRKTRQKEIALRILEGTNKHPTADWIYEQARKLVPQISKGTVYRNLAVLLEEGKISKLDLKGAVSRYEIKQKAHYHFRCEQCGQVIDLECPVRVDINRMMQKETGLKIFSHQLEFRGICRECQSKSVSA